MKTLLNIILITSLFCSCNSHKKEDSIEKWKKEIVETELKFAEMAQKNGIAKAFEEFADENAVLLRNDKLIIGKDSLMRSFKDQNSSSKTGSLTWSPDFVDVSASGDLGYTYGKYTYTQTDSLGNTKSDTGIFHTVWKKLPDGKWRFVWD
jgi:ketosteroid isomerase-like protein